MLRRMGTSTIMTRRVTSNGINEVSDTKMEMTRAGWSGTAAGVSMRTRMATRHAHRDGRRSETSNEGITFGHDTAGANN